MKRCMGASSSASSSTTSPDAESVLVTSPMLRAEGAVSIPAAVAPLAMPSSMLCSTPPGLPLPPPLAPLKVSPASESPASWPEEE